ncbi:hypothetical protein [Lentimicrobium sp. S6]|uniref:IS66 family insertion sequence element accessory protein TnpA n=1 Tax=Lentimicrobium sp. S6 TaxID=2735872 RepID=UPI0015531DFC|nr:hypothetical protein [Lentimicrobium sp. S6]NPD48175.1 hypothetical protein [Lentimicrobium sp. S6]
MKKEEMFTMVEAWHKSGLTKQQFVNEHPITYHKLNYWIGQYNKMNLTKEQARKSNFQEICLSEKDFISSQKILELTTLSGTHIVIYS